MFSQAAVEAIYSATYVENYLDCVENVPDDIQRHISQMRELDVTYQAFLRQVEERQEATQQDMDTDSMQRVLLEIQQTLAAAQEVADEKLQVVKTIQDLIENKVKQLDLDHKNHDFTMFQENTEPNREKHHRGIGNIRRGRRGRARGRRIRTDTLSRNPDTNTSPEAVFTLSRGATSGRGTGRGRGRGRGRGGGRGRGRKRGGLMRGKNMGKYHQQQLQQHEVLPLHRYLVPIDPDEPKYCLCDRISFGEMVLCDNDLCPIEWFHFPCVALATKPKGKWFCPKCRGDRSNVMKPKAQFLKELEQYNKEKEEKNSSDLTPS